MTNNPNPDSNDQEIQDQWEKAQVRDNNRRMQIGRREKTLSVEDRVKLFGRVPERPDNNDYQQRQQIKRELGGRSEQARQLEEMINNGGQDSNRALEALRDPELNPMGLQVGRFNEIYQKTGDLQTVGDSAWELSKLIGKGGHDTDGLIKYMDELRSMSRNDELDPTARELARQYEKYMPEYLRYIQTVGQDGGTGRMELDDGEYIVREQTGNEGKWHTHIKNQDGEIIMRPDESDDPRGLGAMNTEIRTNFLSGYTDEHDRKVAGTLTAGQKSTTSLALRQVFHDVDEAMYENDPERMNRIRIKRDQQLESEQQTFNNNNQSKTKKKTGIKRIFGGKKKEQNINNDI